MALKSLQNSTETPPVIWIDPSVIKKNDLTPNKVEIIGDEPVEEIVACLSAKKNAALRKRKNGLEEEEYDENTMENPEKSILRDKDDSKTIFHHKSECDKVNDLADENMARKDGEEIKKKKRRSMIPSDGKKDDFALIKSGGFRTDIEKNVRRKLALDELIHKREQKRKGLSDAAEGLLEESKVSSLLGESDLDGFAVDQDSKSQDLLSSSDDESSGDESDLEGFVEKNSQSQDLTIACSYLYNPTEEEMFEVLIKNLLQSSVDALPEENDYRLDRAQTHWEKLINTKKENQVASSTWKNYKKSLMNCPVVKSEPRQNRPRKGKCQACSLPRSLTEWIVCYQPDGEVIEFEVGCFCAERGLLYHDLHHLRQKLKESCYEKTTKVRHKAGTKTPEEIVEECLDDQAWLDMLFNNFQSVLNAADGWTSDGDKRKAMQKYCRSFDPCY